MRRTIVALILSLSILASCSPYDSPAGASPAPAPSATGKDPCAKGDKPCWTEHIRKRQNERVWWLEVQAQQKREAERRRIERIYAFAAAIEAQRLEAIRRASYPSGQCGGSLPPCWVMMRESRGNPRAVSPTGKYRGKWQFDVRTFGGYGGYRYADQAPERIQDERARQVWAGGRGCSHWAACGRR